MDTGAGGEGGGDAGGGEALPFFFLCFFLCRFASLSDHPSTPSVPSMPPTTPTTAPRRDLAVARPRKSPSNWFPSNRVLLVMSGSLPGVQSDGNLAGAQWEKSPSLGVGEN